MRHIALISQVPTYTDNKKPDISIKPVHMKIILASLIILLAIPVMAYDNGVKEKVSKSDKKDEIRENTSRDIGAQVQLKYGDTISDVNYDESVETMASWHISQSIPKPEKVSKKEEQQQVKIERKRIRKEKKECRKLRQSLKKNKFQSYSDQ